MGITGNRHDSRPLVLLIVDPPGDPRLVGQESNDRLDAAQVVLGANGTSVPAPHRSRRRRHGWMRWG